MRIPLLIHAAIAAVAVSAQTLPQPLRPGDKVAIITPSSCIDSSVVEKGMNVIRDYGLVPVTGQHVFGHRNGSYTATDPERAADIMWAFTDPDIKAIICSRGGYGATRLLPMLDEETIKQNPKWLVGFSDISALHAFLTKAGVASIHGPMCKYFSENPTDVNTKHVFELLMTDAPYSFEAKPHKYNKPGKASGKIVGGNFIVVNNLAQTPYDVFDISDGEDTIIFVEEVGEKIYAVERMLLRLHQSGALNRAKGLIFGQFTEYKGDANDRTMEDMIHRLLKEWGYYDKENFPIAFGIEAGHGEVNVPIILGATSTMEVAPDYTIVNQR